MSYDVDVIFTSWARSINRVAYLITCFKALYINLQVRYDIKYNYHVASEGLDAPFLRDVDAFCAVNDIQHHVKPGPPCLSTMLNFANFEVGDAEYILFMQDDWNCQKFLPLPKYLSFLKDNDAKMVKLNWRDDFQAFAHPTGEHGIVKLAQGMRGYYYSDNPHIKKRSYHAETGPFPDSMVEGVDQGRCENAMNRTCKRIGGIYTSTTTYFTHIGHETTLTDKTFPGR